MANAQGAKYFSTLDLRAGYHHIGLTTDSIPKTAFTSLFGKYEYVKVPFRLAQAPAYFQELMTGVLKDLPFAMAYLDDIIIYSSTPEEHLEHIRTVFEKLRYTKLSMKLSKCHFFAKKIQYLGHILGTEEIKPVPAKTEAIRAMHPPVNPKQSCTFLGLVGYYRKFIKNFAKIAKPLTMLTRMDVKFEWKETHHDAFMKLLNSHYTAIMKPLYRHPFCDTQTQQNSTLCTQMPPTMLAELNSHRYMTEPNSSSFLVAYIYRHPEEMEYTQTRSLWYLLHHQEMELLPPRNRHHSKKRPQTSSMILKWKERKYKNQQIGTTTRLL